MKFHLDPRVKLYMIFVVSAVVMMSATSPFLWAVKILITMVPIVLLAIERKYSSVFRFLVLYLVALYTTFVHISEASTGLFMALLVGYCSIIVQFMPAFITAWYIVKTTKIGEFISAMQKMHVPDGITISLAVVMRFFPTINEEYISIRDAMKMRGITFGNGSVINMIEYRMIPLLFSCVNIGDELSAAAITRGLGGKMKRSSVEVLSFSIIDYVFVCLFTIAACIFIGHKYFK